MSIDTVIIASNMQLAQDVRQRIVNHDSPSLDRGPGNPFTSCPQIPALEYLSMSLSSAVTALRDLQGWTPRRIVIVDYPQWRTAPGGMWPLWYQIQVCRTLGTQVIWW